MTGRVLFAWWAPSNGGSQQAFVCNHDGLAGAGHEVAVFTDRSLDTMVSKAAGADWALVPFVFYPEVVEALAERTHVHLQIGGYGADDWDAAERSIEAADSVSVLDPHLAQRFGVVGEPWIPNPPNRQMFSAQPVPPDGYVLVPKQAEGGGLGEARRTVEEHPDTDFVVRGSSFPDPPDNVTIKPKAPLSWMPEVYAGAKAVLNPHGPEGLPNVAYESFLTGTPYVCLHGEGIGHTQKAAEPPVGRIGEPCADVLVDVPANGDHYARDLESADPEVGCAGREWVERWFESGWTWVSKAEAVADVVAASG